MIHPTLLALQRWRLQQRIQQRFDDLEAFAMQVEMSLSRDRAAVQADGAVREIFYPERVEDHEIELFQEDMRRLADDFPQVLRSSSLATIQASLEVNLLAIARFYASSVGSIFDAITWQKTKGGRIWGVKAFLEKEHAKAGVSGHWSKVSDYVNVRNAIAHGDGSITEVKDTVATRASVGRLEPYVRIDGEQIIIDQEAVRDFAQASKYLCLDLLTAQPHGSSP